MPRTFIGDAEGTDPYGVTRKIPGVSKAVNARVAQIGESAGTSPATSDLDPVAVPKQKWTPQGEDYAGPVMGQPEVQDLTGQAQVLPQPTAAPVDLFSEEPSIPPTQMSASRIIAARTNAPGGTGRLTTAQQQLMSQPVNQPIVAGQAWRNLTTTHADWAMRGGNMTRTLPEYDREFRKMIDEKFGGQNGQGLPPAIKARAQELYLQSMPPKIREEYQREQQDKQRRIAFDRGMEEIKQMYSGQKLTDRNTGEAMYPMTVDPATGLKVRNEEYFTVKARQAAEDATIATENRLRLSEEGKILRQREEDTAKLDRQEKRQQKDQAFKTQLDAIRTLDRREDAETAYKRAEDFLASSAAMKVWTAEEIVERKKENKRALTRNFLEQHKGIRDANGIPLVEGPDGGLLPFRAPPGTKEQDPEKIWEQTKDKPTGEKPAQAPDGNWYVKLPDGKFKRVASPE